MSKDLPSIDDFGVDENLPSVEDFITEEKAEELPSVEDFIEKEEEVIEEATQTIEDADGNSFAEVKDIVPPWPELVRMINDVRSDIPDIPEVKYYDQELQDLAEQISKLPEVRYYDREVEAICEQIDAVREQVKDLPEVKYYDEQVNAIEDRIDSLQTDVANLPEVKYYDAEIEAICEAIDQVKASIPKFPKWVNEVNEVPDFSWIGKTFSVIDDDFIKVNDTIDTLRERVDYNLKELSEDIDKKKFEAKVELDTKSEEIETKIKEEKDKIWKEMRESSLRIWEYHKEFKDDDRKLKKQILGEYNNLKKNIDKELKEINYTSVKTDELLLKYFTELKEEISELPEVKYYDKDIDYVKTDIKDLYKLVEDIKSSQKKLQEEQQLLSETNVQFGEDPPDTSNIDPLTPLDQNFVTLDQLQQHYKTFVQRVQYQLSSIGGGGAGFIKDLDDVTFNESTGTNQLLIYNGSKWVGIASTALSGGSGGDADSASKLVLDVRNQNIGYGLTIGTPVYQVAYNSGQDRLDVEESRASDSTTMPAKGVVGADLANNTNGQIIVYGELEGVNTQAFDVGDELFVAPGGGLTNVRPTDPTHLVQKIAVVLKKSTANGAILVYGAGRTNDVPNNISIAGSVTAVDGFFSGNVTVGGTITYEDVKNVDSLGIVTARTGIDVLAGGINVVGVSTISTGIGTVQIGVGNTALIVQGNARVTGILTVGEGSITLNPVTKQVTGIDEVVVGSGASVSLAPLFTSSGTFVVDYSTLTLSGYSSAVNGTYNRQSTSFVLSYGPTYSGSARFLSYSGYYYFLHESDNSKIIIYNIYDGYWSAVYSSGSDFSSPYSSQQVYPVTNSNVITPVRASYDSTGRAYPGSGSGIEYLTRITDHTSSLGIATGSSLDVSGIVTAGTGINVLAGGINVTGVSTFYDNIHVRKTSANILFYDSSGNYRGNLRELGGNFEVGALNELRVAANNDVVIKDGSFSYNRGIFKDTSVELYYSNSKKFETTGTGVTVFGTTETQQLNVSGVSTSSGGFVGDLTGDVTGNLVGNVTGDVTGDVTGNLVGNVTGNVTGDVTGNADTSTKVYVDESEDDNAFYNIIFTDEDPGSGNSYHTMQVDHTGLVFNPGTNTLRVQKLETPGSTLDVNDELKVNDTLRVRASNSQFVVENGSGTNKFVVDSDNGNTEVMGTLDVDGDATFSGNVTATTVEVSNAFYMPQYTTTARDAGSFNEGAMIYNTTTKKMEFYDGTTWQQLPGMSLGLTVALDG